jgi:hypothetical protein
VCESVRACVVLLVCQWVKDFLLWRKSILINIRDNAGKFLARPGRIQATGNKLGIYSEYSTLSSTHLLACCSNFSKPLKKIQNFVRPTRSPWQRWRQRRTKIVELSIFAQVGQCVQGCTCPVSRGTVVQQQGLLWWPSLRVIVFTSKIVFICIRRHE